MAAERYNLLVEKPDVEAFEFIIEENSSKPGADREMYISGPYMVANTENKNNRVYPIKELKREADRYVKDMVDKNRAMGELNHPTSAEVDLERACHRVISLEQDGNVWMGKSKVLTTPTGLIVQSLIRDGCSLGMSTRSLGKLDEIGKDKHKVKDMRLIAIDCVADPSYPKAFVNGILESKKWVCNNDGSFCELYDAFENSLHDLPRRDVEVYLRDQIVNFINKVKQKQ